MSATTSSTTVSHLPAIIQTTARTGYAARAVVYVIMGVLAALAALELGGATVGSRGVLDWVLSAPLGSVLLTVLAVGLVAYCVWRAIQVVYDPDDHGLDAKGIVVRAALSVSILTHALLAFAALSRAWGSSGGGGGSTTTQTVDSLMSTSWGPWVVGAAGLAVICAAIAYAYRAWTAKFEERMRIPSQHRSWALPVGRFGLATRAVAFMVSGGLAVALALGYSAETGGMKRIIELMQNAGWGPWPLLAVATGFVCFGVYSSMEALWRKVDSADVVYNG